MACPGKDLSCFDRDIQMVLLGRERASSVVGEGARRTIGLVEVYNHFAVFVRVRVMITTRGIRAILVGQVHELDEETSVWQFLHHQRVLFPIQFKGYIALHWFI